MVQNEFLFQKLPIIIHKVKDSHKGNRKNFKLTVSVHMKNKCMTHIIFDAVHIYLCSIYIPTYDILLFHKISNENSFLQLISVSRGVMLDGKQ